MHPLIASFHTLHTKHSSPRQHADTLGLVTHAGSLDILTSNNDNIVRCFSAETFQEKRCGTTPPRDAAHNMLHLMSPV